MSSSLLIFHCLVYFVLIMEKVQTGQVIEFYSNSCLVKTNIGEFNCIAIKNIVVGDFDGYLHWLDSETGNIVGRYDVGGDGVYVAPVVDNNIMYVQTRDGDIIALDTQSGNE